LQAREASPFRLPSDTVTTEQICEQVDDSWDFCGGGHRRTIRRVALHETTARFSKITAADTVVSNARRGLYIRAIVTTFELVMTRGVAYRGGR
jgi:hypothetical protein